MLGMFIGTRLGVYAYWRKILVEERALTEAFGAEYVDYKQHSSALIPWLP
jgi:protein-S-isoprenylcysteine O-methyltransferase Ste14